MRQTGRQEWKIDCDRRANWRFDSLGLPLYIHICILQINKETGREEAITSTKGPEDYSAGEYQEETTANTLQVTSRNK